MSQIILDFGNGNKKENTQKLFDKFIQQEAEHFLFIDGLMQNLYGSYSKEVEKLKEKYKQETYRTAKLYAEL